jgi:hypothetical protein
MSFPKSTDTSPGNINKVLIGHYKDTFITAAQILAMYATPISIAPAPAAGHANIFDGAFLTYNYATAFTSTVRDLEIRYTDHSGQICVTAITGSSFLDATSDQLRWAPPLATAAGAAAFTPVVAAALVINCGTGEIGTGTSTLFVRCFFHVVPTFL